MTKSDEKTMTKSDEKTMTKSEEKTNFHLVYSTRGYETSSDGKIIKWIDIDEYYTSGGVNIAFSVIPTVLHQNPQIQQMSMEGIILDTKYSNLSELKRIKTKLIVPKLIIQGNFNQHISQEDFPSSVKQVKMGCHYDCPLVGLPFTHVQVGSDFQELIQMDDLLSIVFERILNFSSSCIIEFVEYLGQNLKTPKLIHVRLGSLRPNAKICQNKKLLEAIQENKNSLPASLKFICYEDVSKCFDEQVHLGKIDGKWQVINSECNCHEMWNTELYSKWPVSTGTGLF